MASINEDGLDQSIENEETQGDGTEEMTCAESQLPLENSVEKGDGDGQLVAADPGGAIVPSNLSKEAQGPEQPMVSFVRLYSFADKYDYALMFLGTIGAVVHGASAPMVIYFLGEFLNGIGGDPANLRHAVDKYALYFEWVGLVCFASTWLEVSLWMQTGERQSAKLRVKYLQALLRQDIPYFDAETRTGGFVNSIASDPLMVQDAISEKTGNFIHYISTLVTAFILGFFTQWRIALLTLAIVPPIALVAGLYFYYLTRITTKAASANSEAASIAEQAISQVRTVYSFVSEDRFVRSYYDALQKSMKLGTKGGLAKGLGVGATGLTLNFSYAVLVLHGGAVVRKGDTNGAVALSTVFNVLLGCIALGQTVPSISAFARARSAASKIFQMIQHEPSINRLDKSAYELQTVEGHIELRNVDFSYPSRPDALVFQNLSLIIPSGQTVAIVGSSGSGKSTVVSLIERFYDPTAGKVLLDGHDLKKLDLKWLRRQIGLVNQEPSLFATSIAANIMYGIDNASQEKIEDAAKLANIHSFISELPLGYQTQVGERGIQLSGGQRQRIAIARAMLRKPRVLLLDEATSALDAGSEQVVQEALDRIMVERTTVVVAHRLSTISNADIIAVVQQGRIVENCTRQDFTSREEGAFSALARLQQLAIINEGGLRGSTSPHPRRSSSGSSPRATVSDLLPTYHKTSTVDAAGKGKATGPSKRKQEFSIKASKGSFTRLIAITKEDWTYSIVGVIGSIGTGCLYPIIALMMGQVLSIYYRTNEESIKIGVSTFCLYFVGIGLVSALVSILQHYPLGVVGERLVKRVREKMFATILRNEPGWFDEDDNNSSQVAARLDSDAANVRVALGDTISVILQNLTMFLLSMTLSLVLQWKMALVMISIFPMVTISFVAETWFLGGFAEGRANAYARTTQVAGEAVSNIRTVAAFNAADKIQAVYVNELKGLAKQSFRKGQVVGFGYGFSQYLSRSAEALVLWYGGILVEKGQATLGDAAKIFFILIICSFTAAETLALTPALARGGQAVASVFQILDRVTKIEPNDNQGKQVGKIRGDIELKDVTLAYPSRPDVVILRNLNLKVLPGRSLGLVGASGCGKSSVISLIERFYDPLSGEILIDGMDIKKYNLQSLRHHIALVQQEPALFATTIYENICYGKDGASEAEVIQAAKAANAHKFISSLPNGYKTQVGERGVQLSGGQKQRVAIARAVLKDPAIFLLDEATSALDTESEKIVQEALDRLMKGRTAVIVAHRLSTIRRADSIAVLQDGNIVEEGSHSALLSQGGRYARLIDLQNRVREVQSRFPGIEEQLLT